MGEKPFFEGCQIRSGYKKAVTRRDLRTRVTGNVTNDEISVLCGRPDGHLPPPLNKIPKIFDKKSMRLIFCNLDIESTISTFHRFGPRGISNVFQ